MARRTARARPGTPTASWPDLRLLDFLNLVVRTEPVVVRGALGFGLKAIGTSLANTPTDGLGTMVGAWSAAGEARRGGAAPGQVELMREIERYNEVDCRVIAEVIGCLRAKH